MVKAFCTLSQCSYEDQRKAFPYPESDLGKALPLLWFCGIVVLDMTMLMSTKHIYSGLHQLSTGPFTDPWFYASWSLTLQIPWSSVSGAMPESVLLVTVYIILIWNQT